MNPLRDVLPPGFRPRVFALLRHVADDDTTCDDYAIEGEAVVVAWGMTLPDGSAVAIGCGSSPTIGLVSCPERAAWINGAEVAWVSSE
jgi:hypothetical protein